MNRAVIASTILGAAMAVPGNAVTLPAISPYNALIFGNFTDNSDVGGGVAAAGSVVTERI
jgi:hypothetical protein